MFTERLHAPSPSRSRVIRWVRYRDWHRVERARAAFALEAALLEESGWNEACEASRADVRRARPLTASQSSGRSPTRVRADDRATALDSCSRPDTAAARTRAA